MKKITKKEAIQLIQKGIFPACEVSRDNLHFIDSISELERLESLSNVQGFVLWGYENSELESFTAPHESISITVNEAIDLIANNTPIVCIKVIGEEEKVFVEKNQLNDFLTLYRECDFEKIPFLLYWYE